MTPHPHPASSSPTAAQPLPGRSVGPIRRLAWVVVSGLGTVLWLQYPNDLWFLGNLLLGLSPALLFPSGSHRQSVAPRAAVVYICALLLIVFSPIAAYYMFGWSLRQHPRAIFGIKIAWVFVWLVAAANQLRLVFTSRRNPPAAQQPAAADSSPQPPIASA